MGETTSKHGSLQITSSAISRVGSKILESLVFNLSVFLFF